MGLRTNVYIDGFNLYYGILKSQPNRKWLDLSALARALRPKAHINRIRYFTAPVVGLPSDPQEPVRQQVYLRALATLPTVSVHLGQFLSNPVMRPLVSSIASGHPRFVEVLQFGEKGSDVNLATMLLCDAADRDFEQAIVISNDSDLMLPIERVRNKFSLSIGVYSPRPSVTSQLRQAASFCSKLRPGVVEACQFPAVMTDANGTFQKPPHW